MPTQRFDAVLFDCDGVLVDSEPISNRVLADMLGELGARLSVEETIRTFTPEPTADFTLAARLFSWATAGNTPALLI